MRTDCSDRDPITVKVKELPERTTSGRAASVETLPNRSASRSNFLAPLCRSGQIGLPVHMHARIGSRVYRGLCWWRHAMIHTWSYIIIAPWIHSMRLGARVARFYTCTRARDNWRVNG